MTKYAMFPTNNTEGGRPDSGSGPLRRPAGEHENDNTVKKGIASTQHVVFRLR